MVSINLYAEVLTNIRQVTLHASLQTTRNEETRIEISSDKRVITVSHDGESVSLYLPTQISGTANVTIPAEKKKDLSLRLAIEDTSGMRLPPGDKRAVAPWMAEEMTLTTSLCCKACERVLLPTGKITQWQDLPSESWYEMLDYLHCHKHGENGDEEPKALPETTNVFRARSGLGMIDNASFLFHHNDVSDTMVRAGFSFMLRSSLLISLESYVSVMLRQKERDSARTCYNFHGSVFDTLARK